MTSQQRSGDLMVQVEPLADSEGIIDRFAVQVVSEAQLLGVDALALRGEQSRCGRFAQKLSGPRPVLAGQVRQDVGLQMRTCDAAASSIRAHAVDTRASRRAMTSRTAAGTPATAPPEPSA